MNNNCKKNMANILVVDDDKEIRNQLKWALNQHYHVFVASNSKETKSILKQENIDLVSLDIALSDSKDDYTGLKLLKQILHMNPFVKIIMVTGQDERKLALEAIKYGAFDYYQKPIDINELSIIFKRAFTIKTLEEENRALQKKLEDRKQFQEIIGNSFQMKKVFDSIEKVATTDVTVLISGESGTGKELVAKAIFNLSDRKEKPFVAINCGAIPENLLESELFGHEKGAFTGAYYKKIGKFEQADEGTIFLDEVGELSLNLQVKLLRFLQERNMERIGSNSLIPVNVRIIAASNKNLEEEVKIGNFREDLFYRLGVITISLPLLQDRGEDILLLAYHFLNLYNSQYKKNIKGFSVKTEENIKKYSWPGNVREMENKIKRAVIMSNDSYINSTDLQLSQGICLKYRAKGLKGLLYEVERKAIMDALQFYTGNISKASEMLDISRASFYDLLKKYNINKQDYKKKKSKLL